MTTTTAIIADAVRAAIDMISIDRQSFVDCSARPDGSISDADGLILREYDDALDKLRAALHEAECAEQVEPAAYRVECRWADPALDQTWRKYVDCTSRDAAEVVRSRFRVPGDMETRIVPLYAGEPEESR